MKKIFVILILLLIIPAVIAEGIADRAIPLVFNELKGRAIGRLQQEAGEDGEAFGLLLNMLSGSSPVGLIFDKLQTELQKENPDTAELLNIYSAFTNPTSYVSNTVLNKFIEDLDEEQKKGYQVIQQIVQLGPKANYILFGDEAAEAKVTKDGVEITDKDTKETIAQLPPNTEISETPEGKAQVSSEGITVLSNDVVIIGEGEVIANKIGDGESQYTLNGYTRLAKISNTQTNIENIGEGTVVHVKEIKNKKGEITTKITKIETTITRDTDEAIINGKEYKNFKKGDKIIFNLNKDGTSTLRILRSSADPFYTDQGVAQDGFNQFEAEYDSNEKLQRVHISGGSYTIKYSLERFYKLSLSEEGKLTINFDPTKTGAVTFTRDKLIVRDPKIIIEKENGLKIQGPSYIIHHNLIEMPSDFVKVFPLDDQEKMVYTLNGVTYTLTKNSFEQTGSNDLSKPLSEVTVIFSLETEGDVVEYIHKIGPDKSTLNKVSITTLHTVGIAELPAGTGGSPPLVSEIPRGNNPPKNAIISENNDALIDLIRRTERPKDITNDLLIELVLDEGVSYYSYADSASNPIVGAGFNLDRGDAERVLESLGLSYNLVNSRKEVLSKEQTLFLLEYAVADVIQNVRIIPSLNYDTLPSRVQSLVVNLVYQHGIGAFKRDHAKLIKAISQHDYGAAVNILRDSRYYSKFPNRANHMVIKLINEDIDSPSVLRTTQLPAM